MRELTNFTRLAGRSAENGEHSGVQLDMKSNLTSNQTLRHYVGESRTV